MQNLCKAGKKECLVSSVAVTILLLVVILNIVPVATSTTYILAAISLVIQVVRLLPCLTLGLLLVKIVHALGLSQPVHLHAHGHVDNRQIAALRQGTLVSNKSALCMYVWRTGG